jgi:PAS domain S-box-containing protein
MTGLKRIFSDNIRFRFLSVTAIILVAGTLTLSSIIAVTQEKILQNSLLANGQSLASFIAKLSKDPLVIKDVNQLNAIVNEANKEDIVYTVISDEEGHILTSQFASINYRSPRYRSLLAGLSRDHELREIIAAIKKQEPIREVSVPVMIDIKPIGKVSIGISEYRMRRQIVQSVLFVIVLNLFVALALGLALFFASKKMILDPVTALSHATSALAVGDFSSRVNVETTGEVKLLVDRFNHMLDNLEKVTVSKAYVDAIIKSMIDTLIVASTDGRILLANAAVLSLLGYEEEELVGKPIEIIFDDSTAAGNEMLGKIVAKGRVSNVETTYRTKDGTRVVMLFSGSTMTDRNGIYGVVCVAKDVTERKQSEEDKQKLVSQLIQVQKMESVGQLAGGIAHDFNNILTAIIGNCNIVQKKLPADDPVRLYVDTVFTAAQKAAGLVKSLLAFSRKQVISPLNMDLNDFIRKEIHFLGRVIGENIELQITLFDHAIIIFADMTQMEQVLINLATNARDAMPGGGKLILQTEQVVLDNEFRRRRGFGTRGAYAVLTVRDTGHGIDEQIKEKIFEPFFTTKEVGRGTGLGLSTVYGIIKQNSGYITVDSELGKGTVFKIYLPVVSVENERHLDSEAHPPIRGGTETILIAEDDEAVRTLTRNSLVEHGYRVIEAADGEQALGAFRKHKDSIHLLLIDVMMPKMNGKDLYNAALREKADIKALFVSGYPSDLIRKEGVLEKGLNFISKPSSLTDILRKIREVLDQKVA